MNIELQDACGETSAIVHQYIVVYDPDGGFVTGGGWINSPPGAYPADPSLEGKANFGFVSKYQMGANVPIGQTEFKFKAGDLNFKSVLYEWLIIAGPQAKFKGDGTINGIGLYGFMVSAIDGQVNGGGGMDKFRIKIWDKATDVIVYDNQIGDDDDATPNTVLGGGSITIHNGGGGNSNIANSDNLWPINELAVYPNPFEHEAKLYFKLSEESKVVIDIFSTDGKRVKQLISTNLNGGYHGLTWDGSNYAGLSQPPGVYLVRMQTSGDALVKLITYMK